MSRYLARATKSAKASRVLSRPKIVLRNCRADVPVGGVRGRGPSWNHSAIDLGGSVREARRPSTAPAGNFQSLAVPPTDLEGGIEQCSAERTVRIPKGISCGVLCIPHNLHRVPMPFSRE
jgi:hypothetical protein